ncbi:ABC transporter substrate-binding protein [Corynebacterium glyciniphilum]|uniref:peptide ABC transporter substrate-binding protein n=1 Tax=Corynebacterium glyciniphilum TaxID=1404244 RepID=UPI00265227C0|nr:ABC transporter substrate-binding protein [Corynebacterium glyciniphilum]MDN5683251.1 ABC transporter substrate-binding protein [Corynebacterium glyciniphilum]MDN6707120.1 ABC transporter substrate-binding protein [Corynebacterium glyciniphilum]
MRIRPRRALAATLTGLALLLSTTACVPDRDDIPSDYITFFGGEPQNPLLTTNTNEVQGGEVLRAMYTGLVGYSPDGEPYNAVAEDIEPNDDSSSFHVTLKDGWTFTNGEPVTSASFIDAWNFGATSANAQLGADFFSAIEGYDDVAGEDTTATEMSGLTEINDHEFTVDLSAPDASFSTQLGYYAFSPLPQVAFDDIDAFGQHPIGNGPYMLDGDDAWQHNVSIQLKANPDYVGDDKAQNPGIAFKHYADVATAYADLQSGDLDHMRENVGPRALPSYRADFPDSNGDAPYAAIQNFTIPENLPGFQTDEEGRLRRAAISMAIDRELIIDKLFFGGRQVAEDFGAPTLEGGIADVPGKEVLTFQPDKARELWEKANEIKPYSGESFQIAYNADGGHQQWVEGVTNSIRQVLGIKASGKAYPTFQAQRDAIVNRTVGSAFRSGWNADYPSISSFLVSNYRTGGGSNDGDYSNPEFDKLLAQASSSPDSDAAQTYYDEAQAVLMEDLPQIPLWYYAATTAWDPGLHNVETNWQGMPVYTEITKDGE